MKGGNQRQRKNNRDKENYANDDADHVETNLSYGNVTQSSNRNNTNASNHDGAEVKKDAPPKSLFISDGGDDDEEGKVISKQDKQLDLIDAEGNDDGGDNPDAVHMTSARRRFIVRWIISSIAIVMVVTGIAVTAVILSRDNTNEECTTDTSCSFSHAIGLCTKGQCLIGACKGAYDDCNNNTKDGCEIDLQTNANHCGFCHSTCRSTLANAVSQCQKGVCAIQSCLNDFGNCNNHTADGCEIQLQTNEHHCGACGNSCHTLPNVYSTKCVKGLCVITRCQNGFWDCDGNPSTGCESSEITWQTDTQNCGFCGNICNLANAQHSQCHGGECVIDSCLDDFHNCDGMSNTGCEVNVQTNVNHCGSCTNNCTFVNANAKCVEGECVMDKCLNGFGNCDDDDDDNDENSSSTSTEGCKTNLQTNVNHCGSCHNTCSNLANVRSTTCDGGVCIIESCLDGLANCKGDDDTTTMSGCETHLLSNDNHCGMCNSPCTMRGDSCRNGVCLNVQRSALTSLYESTNGDNWTMVNAQQQQDWGSPHVHECDWHGVTCSVSHGKVTKLRKASSNLQGTLPTEIGLLTDLVSLTLRHNYLPGPIPSTLGQLTKLTYLHLDANSLTGLIPTELGRLHMMEDLYLWGNYLSGTLPSEMATMTKLTYLTVYDNILERLPSEICDMGIPNLYGDCVSCPTRCCTSCFC